MKSKILRVSYVLIFLSLLYSCYKVDPSFLNKRNDKDKFYFLPEEFVQRDQVWFKSYFMGNNPKAKKIFIRTWGGDDSLLIDLKWVKNKVYFTIEKDTCFTAILNAKGQVKEVLPGNFRQYVESLSFPAHLIFEYSNDKIIKITSNNSNLLYDFDYDNLGNCKALYYLRRSEEIGTPLRIVDLGLFEHYYNKNVNAQFYFFSIDILLISQLQILDFLGILPGLQPNNIQKLSKLSDYHGTELENWYIIDHKLDDYGNLISYSYLGEEYNERFPSSITWKKFKK